MKNNIYFVGGIDTNVGKSYATGFLAKIWREEGLNTITHKLIQTGNTDLSEDIELHRRIMELPLLQEDIQKITMPQIFSYPASPHLASQIDKREIDFAAIENSVKTLSDKFDRVLVEGAGGLMVPLTRNLLTIDYIKEWNIPTILVTGGKLGSVNHTILSLEAIANRGMELSHLVYNRYPSIDPIIEEDTLGLFKELVPKFFPYCQIVELPLIELK